jgi:hypothetical protein
VSVHVWWRPAAIAIGIAPVQLEPTHRGVGHAQASQSAPRAPQLSAVVPSTHAEPFQQPVQHAPPKHAPPVHGFESSFAEAHDPSGIHTESVHGFASVQGLHIEPAAPQNATSPTEWQRVESQQPVQHLPP